MKVFKFMLSAALLLAATACDGNEELSDAYGNFEASEVLVSAENSGRLEQFAVEEGITLAKGSIVGMVDTIPLSLQRRKVEAQRAALATRITNVKAEIAILEEQKRVAGVELRRIRALLADSAAPAKQLDDIQGSIAVLERKTEAAASGLHTVRAEMHTLDVQMEHLDDQLRRCMITNPRAGTVLATYAEAGEITAYGKPLYRVANLDVMTLRVYISGDQLPEVRLGQNVQVLVDEDGDTMRELTGRVSWISAKAEFTPKIIQTRNERANLVYAVKVNVENDGSLKIGMPAEVNFQPG